MNPLPSSTAHARHPWTGGRHYLALGFALLLPVGLAAAQGRRTAEEARPVHWPPAPRSEVEVSAQPFSSLVMVHDGRGAVTVAAEQASLREMLGLLSRWFDVPILNPEAIPDARCSLRFDRVPVAQAADLMLRGARINYAILTNPETLVPTKIAAAPRPRWTGQPGIPADQASAPAASPAPNPPNPATPAMPATPGEPGPAASQRPAGQMPPVEGPGFVPPVDSAPAFPTRPPVLPDGRMPQLQPPGSAPPVGPALPGLSKPGMVTPTPTPPVKPPGLPGGPRERD